MVTILQANHHHHHHHPSSFMAAPAQSRRSSRASSSHHHHHHGGSGLHIRSQSMPEAVYLNLQQQQLMQMSTVTVNGAHVHPVAPNNHVVVPHTQQQQQQQPHQFAAPPHQPRQIIHHRPSFHYANTSSGAKSGCGGGGSQLRRAQTNASEFSGLKRSRLPPMHHHNRQPHHHHALLQHHQFGGSSTSLHWTGGTEVNAARSRCNIAALYPRQHHQQQQQHQQQQTNAKDFLSVVPLYQHHRSLGFLNSAQQHQRQSSQQQQQQLLSQSCRDLSQPLHVDCSVEYDLGHQPKIPKDSAPLLIIHPAFKSRFHPYEDYHDLAGLKTPEQSRPSSSMMMQSQSAPVKASRSVARHSSLMISNHGTPLIQQPQQQQQVHRHSILLTSFQQPPPQQQPISRSSSSKLPLRQSRLGHLNHLAQEEELFHLSTAAEEEQQQQQQQQQQFKINMKKSTVCATVNHNRQQQGQKPASTAFHLSMPDITTVGARRNLAAKLELEAKTNKRQQQQQQQHHSVESVTKCDSGIGSDEIKSGNFLNHHPHHGESGNGANLGSKWRSSMSGLVTGFLCCSGQPQQQQQQQQQQQHPQYQAQQPPQFSPEILRTKSREFDTSTPIITAASSGSSMTAGSPSFPDDCSPPPPNPLWAFDTPMAVSTPHKAEPWQSVSSSSGSSSGFSSGSPPSTGPTSRAFKVCSGCKRNFDNTDCRDGFCSSQWNKRNQRNSRTFHLQHPQQHLQTRSIHI